ncbi:MAG TPA: hypothetical protein VHV82_03050 [Sporichthyaceae bacterium]|nr:hypothetical protein [Sporichthyaceae bacterium]
MSTTQLTAPEIDAPLIPGQRTSSEPVRIDGPPSAVRALRALALLLILAHQVLPYPTAAATGPTVFVMTLAFLRRSPSCDRVERTARHGGRTHASRRPKVSPVSGVFAWMGLASIVACGLCPLPAIAGAAGALLGALAVHFGSRAAPAAWFDPAFTARPTQYLGRLVFPALGWLALIVGPPALIDRGLPSALRAGLALASLLPAMLTMRQFHAWARNRGRLRPGGSYVIATAATLSLAALVLAPGGLPRPTDTAAELVSAVRTAPIPHPAAAVPQVDIAGLPGGARCWAVAPQFDNTSCIFGETTSNVSVALVGGAHAAQWLPALELLAITRHWRIGAFLAQDCPQEGGPSAACAAWLHRTTSAIGSGDYTLVMLTDSAGASEDAYRTMADELRKAGRKVLTVADAAALAAAG